MHLLGDIATHPDQFDAESAEAYYRKTHGQTRAGVGASHDRNNDDREMGMTYWLEQAEAEMKEIR